MKKLRKMLAVLLTMSIIASPLAVSASSGGHASDIQVVEPGGKAYYLADPEEGEVADETNFDVWTSKTIEGTSNEDEFEITLQVGTTMKAVSDDVAVVLVMDVSGSMMSDEDGNRWYENDMPEGKKRRIEYTREAALKFAEAYVENADNAQRMLSIVQFGNSAETVLPWTEVNNEGILDEAAKQAIDSVEVNFTVEKERDCWDEQLALADFGRVDYWDATEKTVEMQDLTQSYLVTEKVTVISGNDQVETDVTSCTFEGCTETEEHKHCSYEGCGNQAVHSHCTRCGQTEAHTHVTGCTLQGCPRPYEGPHTHCCVHSRDAGIPYFIKYNRWSHTYDYRCLNPDPDHTHEFIDSDICYLTGSRYFGSVWAIGTNMEGGLLLARNLVNAGLADGGAIEGIDNVYVILLSDGNPTWMTTETSTTELNRVMKSTNLNEWEALKDIVKTEEEGDIAIAEDIKAVSKLYAVLYSNDLNKRFSGSHPLAGVSGKEWFENSGTNYVGAHAVYESPKVDELDNTFLQVSDRIDMLTKAWMVTDEMGGIELGDNITFESFTMNGEYATVTPAGNGENTTISWKLGDMEPESGDGSMQNPYIYTLKYKVSLNSFRDNVKAASLAYDAGTSEEAVWTNNIASLQYFMVDKEELDSMTPEQIAGSIRNAEFARPSVKGFYGDYTFVKKNGETGEAMGGAGFTLYNANGSAYGAEVLSDSEGKVTFADIPRGEYTLKETTVPDGMQQMDDLSLKVSWGEVTAADGGTLPEEIGNWPVGGTLPGGGEGNEGNEGNSGSEGNGGNEENSGNEGNEGNEGGESGSDSIPAPGPDVEIEDPDVPLSAAGSNLTTVILLDEAVPLAAIPATGDPIGLWMVMGILSCVVLAGLVYRKNENKTEKYN